MKQEKKSPFEGLGVHIVASELVCPRQLGNMRLLIHSSSQDDSIEEHWSFTIYINSPFIETVIPFHCSDGGVES